MRTADGTPLKVSLARAQRRMKTRALLLVLPLLLFILATFFVPVFEMLFRSVENEVVGNVLESTAPLLVEWDDRDGELPPEEVFAAAKADFEKGYAEKTILKVGRRMNYEKPGFSSLFRKTARRAKRMEPPYKEAFIKADTGWGKVETWQYLKREAGAITISYY
ncbi:MAG: ABC transporter permease, partial [Proteobacteria bacterium]